MALLLLLYSVTIANTTILFSMSCNATFSDYLLFYCLISAELRWNLCPFLSVKAFQNAWCTPYHNPADLNLFPVSFLESRNQWLYVWNNPTGTLSNVRTYFKGALKFLACTFSSFNNVLVLLCVIFLTYMCCPRLCSHGGWLLLKCSAIGIGFNGAETNCGIARLLGILLMNSWDT